VIDIDRQAGKVLRDLALASDDDGEILQASVSATNKTLLYLEDRNLLRVEKCGGTKGELCVIPLAVTSLGYRTLATEYAPFRDRVLKVLWTVFERATSSILAPIIVSILTVLLLNYLGLNGAAEGTEK